MSVLPLNAASPASVRLAKLLVVNVVLLQLDPSHSQRSAITPAGPSPPTRMSCWLADNKAKLAYSRRGGLSVVGCPSVMSCRHCPEPVEQQPERNPGVVVVDESRAHRTPAPEEHNVPERVGCEGCSLAR